MTQFGVTTQGRTVERLSIGSSAHEMTVDVLTYGATIVAVNVPDRHGRLENVVLHYNELHEYEQSPGRRPYYGATIGRYANRIAHARFALDNYTYELSANDGANTLHGGRIGFDQALWDLVAHSPDEIVLSHISPHADQGFPGTLAITVRFSVQERTLRIEYLAQSQADTVVNFTNHSYLNLNPADGTAAGHALQIFADQYTPVDADLIPTGEIRSVADTRFDFRAPRTIGEEAFDTNFVLRQDGSGLAQAAILGHPVSGRMLEILTTEPGLQLYSGNPRGVALETQHFPDSPNHPNFPSTVLRAGVRYKSLSVYRFLETA